ncbi:ABC transporter substrate-binding protein [Halomicrobium mukohataei]|uniref:Ferrichrome-binding protein n=2 Tax=Halomicrobium mukohataei TaxID=57705 RepID=C7P534_HALMD|nr:ABC transporter substrate-binding protein [Halomicrobium mukohataei]ACV49429.1 ferrichrome-binding protein [Halomicrobium mukohataei DSM 12286]QCD67254.1 Fe3+-hydroxamate ABC transporter substrate-binding protein [Halomicrobium mukohataei]
MALDDTTHRVPTRREYIKGGTTLLGVGLLAGCSESESESISTEQPTTSETQAETTTENRSYTVTMEPVGDVEFDSVPESVTVYNPDYIDMMVALGHGDAVESVWYKSRYVTRHYDELDGVSIDVSALTQLYSDGIAKEVFYDIGGDLHLMDPNLLVNKYKNIEQSDIEELESEIAPFFGNTIFRRTDDWHTYRYYTLYEAFEKVAAVFQERERYEAIRSIHDDVVADVEARVPGPDARPNAALVWQGENEPEEFYPYRLSGKGANKEHFHTLGITDAFAGTGVDGLSTTDRGTLDYETLLEVDPDAILLRGHGDKSREEFRNTVLSFMREHSVASQLTAVENETVFRGGPIYAGPLHNLFLLERFAQSFFPDIFTEDQLFDHQRVAEIVTDSA